MNLLSTFAGSMMEGFLPAGWDLSQDRRLLRSRARRDRRATELVAPNADDEFGWHVLGVVVW